MPQRAYGVNVKKHVVIGGASRGLGFFLAQKYLEDGHIVFAGAREEYPAKLIELKKAYPNSLILLQMDVTDTISLENASRKTLEFTEKIDVLINNAGIHSESSFEILEKTNLDDCLSVYDVNSVGPLRTVKAFLPLLRKGSSSKVINISSESGSIGSCQREKEFDYCMSKAALNMGSKLLSNYLRKDAIGVLAIQPGWMRTDMGGQKADLDPYETACKLVSLFNRIEDENHPIFIDNEGNSLLW